MKPNFWGYISIESLPGASSSSLLKKKALKSLNILKIVSGCSRTSDQPTLLKLYRTLTRSKLDYACQINSSAKKKHLQLLDPIHNTGIRIALGVYRTCPITSLYCKSSEPSLNDRMTFISLKYIAKISDQLNDHNQKLLEYPPPLLWGGYPQVLFDILKYPKPLIIRSIILWHIYKRP